MSLSNDAATRLNVALASVQAGAEVAAAINAQNAPAGNNTFSGSNTFTGGLVVTTADVTITDVNVALGTTTGTKIGTAASQKLGFLGATPIVQRVGSAQAAVATTSATNTTPYGYAQAQADAIVTLVNELRAALVAFGLIKGSA